MFEIPKQEDVNESIAPMGAHAQLLLEELEGYSITTERQAKQASAVLVKTKKMIKELEDERTSVTKPLLAVKRKVDGWFSPTVKALKKAEADLKGMLSGFLKMKAEEQTKAIAEGRFDDVQTPELGEGVSARRKTTPKLVDFDAIPEEFLLPPEERVDWGKVRAQFDAGASVPGIELEVDFSIVGSTK